MDKLTKVIHVAVEPNLQKSLKKDAEHSEVPMSWVIRRILREHYANFPVGVFTEPRKEKP